MLTVEDCIGLCELTEDEVQAIAEQMHLPSVIAAELGFYLLHTPDGVPRIKRIILDDIDGAAARGELARVAQLKLVLKHFVDNHRRHRTGSGAAA